MFNNIPLIKRFLTPKKPSVAPTQKGDAIEAYSEQKSVNSAQTTKPMVERRRNPERREQEDERDVYDMRSGDGRRKSDLGKPHIDIDV